MNLHYSIFELSPEQTEFRADNYQYWLIIGGSANFQSGDTQYSLTTHDVLEIPPDVPFQLISENGMQIGCVALTDFETNNRNFHKKNYSSNEVIRKIFFFALDFQGIHHPSKQNMTDLVDHLMFQALLTSGLDEYEINPGISYVIEEFNAHYMEPDYDINPAIEKTGYSQSHFRKMFREATGTPPLEYINRRRIARAKYLLEQSDCPGLREVSTQCGFNDVYYFSRIFKKICGIPPSQYQAEYRKSLQ